MPSGHDATMHPIMMNILYHPHTLIPHVRPFIVFSLHLPLLACLPTRIAALPAETTLLHTTILLLRTLLQVPTTATPHLDFFSLLLMPCRRYPASRLLDGYLQKASPFIRPIIDAKLYPPSLQQEMLPTLSSLLWHMINYVPYTYEP